MLQRRVFGGAEVEVLRASLSDALRMTSLNLRKESKIVAFQRECWRKKLCIGDFTEDGGARGTGGGGEVGGAMVEGFVGEEGEGVGFFGGFGDAKLGRTENFDTTGLVKVSHLRRIVL